MRKIRPSMMDATPDMDPGMMALTGMDMGKAPVKMPKMPKGAPVKAKKTAKAAQPTKAASRKPPRPFRIPEVLTKPY